MFMFSTNMTAILMMLQFLDSVIVGMNKLHFMLTNINLKWDFLFVLLYISTFVCIKPHHGQLYIATEAVKMVKTCK